MLHTFDVPCYTKNGKYIKKHDYNHVFNVFLIFHIEGSIESVQYGYSLDEELEIASNHVFSCISHFSYIRTHRKYATWVLLG